MHDQGQVAQLPISAPDPKFPQDRKFKRRNHYSVAPFDPNSKTEKALVSILAFLVQKVAAPSAKNDRASFHSPIRDADIPQSVLRLDPGPVARRWIWVVLGLGASLYVLRLSATPMQPGNEAMYAYPAIEMVRTGNYLIPQYEHGLFLEKPPLTWLVLATSYRIFGVSLFAERLPGALAALLTVAIVGVWVRRRSGTLSGQTAALVLLFTFKFGAFARTSPADTLLALFVTLSVISLDRCLLEPLSRTPKVWSVAAGLALALAFGVKGLIGIVIPVGAVATGLFLDRRASLLSVRRLAAALFVCGLLLVPWHVVMTQRLGSDFWKTFYWRHQFVRGTTREFSQHIRPPTFYLGALLVSAFPWIAFLFSAWRSRAPYKEKTSLRSSTSYGWLIFGIVFLSCLTAKREVYLMPLLPALAVIVGEYLGSGRQPATDSAIWRISAWISAGVLVLSLLSVRELVQLSGTLETVILLASLAGVVIALGMAARSARGAMPVAIVGAGLAVLFFAVLQFESSLSRWDPIPAWGALIAADGGSERVGVRVDVPYTSLDFYSRFEWYDVKSVACVSELIPRSGWVVVDSAEEGDLARHGTVELVERRPWLRGAWTKVLFQARGPALKSLSLAGC